MKFVEADEAAVYEVPADRPMVDKEPNPFAQSFTDIPKTDEERIQNIPHVVPLLIGKEIVVTRKEDGCSATFSINNGQFLIRSRNYILTEETKNKGNDHYYQIASNLNMEERFKSLGRNLAFQGEIIGPKICSNRLKVSSLFYRVFNIFDIDDQIYLAHSEVIEICAAVGLETVPVLFQGVVTEDDPRFSSVTGILEYADSVMYGPGNPAEGIVVKGNYRYPRETPVEVPSEGEKLIQRLSFKAISNQYLLKKRL